MKKDFYIPQRKDGVEFRFYFSFFRHKRGRHDIFFFIFSSMPG